MANSNTGATPKAPPKQTGEKLPPKQTSYPTGGKDTGKKG